MQRVRNAANRGVTRSTEAVRSEALSLIANSPADGRAYQRRGVTHIASSPGNPFRSDTGNATRLISTRYNRARLMGVVNSGAAYALELEFGTAKMEARPYLRPALANKRGEIVSNIVEELRAEFRT